MITTPSKTKFTFEEYLAYDDGTDNHPEKPGFCDVLKLKEGSKEPRFLVSSIDADTAASVGLGDPDHPEKPGFCQQFQIQILTRGPIELEDKDSVA
jgi:hypothetical protein